MKLTDKLMNTQEFKRERKEFERILTHALQRKNYQYFDKTEVVVVPEEIRKAYFELFQDSVDKKSIQHGIFQGTAFLDSKINILFYGRSLNGANFVLRYLPKKVDLEISTYSFNEEKGDVGIREIGLISTHLNGEGNFQTDLKVGDTFAYHSGYVANHSISNIIDKLQKSRDIPKIPQNQLVNLPKYLEHNFLKSASNGAG